MRKWYSFLVFVALLGNPTASLANPLTYEVVGIFDSNDEPLSGQSFNLLFAYNTDGDKANQKNEVVVQISNLPLFHAPGTITVDDAYGSGYLNLLNVYADNFSHTLQIEFHMIFSLALTEDFLTLNEPLPLNQQEHGDFFVWNGEYDFLGSAHQNQPVIQTVIQTVPEPETFVLLISGLLWLGFSRCRRRVRV